MVLGDRKWFPEWLLSGFFPIPPYGRNTTGISTELSGRWIFQDGTVFGARSHSSHNRRGRSRDRDTIQAMKQNTKCLKSVSCGISISSVEGIS